MVNVSETDLALWDEEMKDGLAKSLLSLSMRAWAPSDGTSS